jgi:putative ABC transport system permease protein
MNILQSFKMAWRSIAGKRGRSILTILSIFIGIAAVMTIVSVMEGMKDYTRQQYSQMGSNKITVSIYSWMWDENGNSTGKDYFPDLYNYCNSISEYVLGVSPQGYVNATVSYGTKTTANAQYEYDEQTGRVKSAPPRSFYASDQYLIVNSYELAKGRNLTLLDIEDYHQVCVIGPEAANYFFERMNPIGKKLLFNGNEFEVVGLLSPKGDGTEFNQNDNVILLPYTTRRVLGGEAPTEFQVQARDSESLPIAMSLIGGFLKGLVDNRTGGYNVYSESNWQQYENQYLTMISLVLGGIAAISLVVGGIGIMNIMLVTVTERTKEIGIRRAIGAQKSSIISQFLIEAGMLCGMGGLVGIFFGTIGSLVLGNLLYHITIWPLPWVTAAALGLSIFLGLIFGSYPAWKAANLQPVEALRAE